MIIVTLMIINEHISHIFSIMFTVFSPAVLENLYITNILI